MPDREKIVKALECCINEGDAEEVCPNCPYEDKHPFECTTQLMMDALALLREQDTVEHALEVLKAHGWKDGAEAVEPNKPGTAYKTIWSCGVCSHPLSTNWVACPSCGKAVKWDDA